GVVEAVRVPAAGCGGLAADRVGEVDGDELGAGLDQAPGEQEALAVGVTAVGFAEQFRLGREVEGVAQARRVQHRNRGGGVIVQAPGGGGVVQQVRLVVDQLLQLAAFFEPADR